MPLLLLGVLTWRQAGLYVDHATLFRHNTEAYPESWQARCQLSAGLLKQAKHEEAAAELGRAVSLEPDDRHGILLELALLQVSLGRTEEAQRSFEAALLARPGFPEGHLELARFLARQGRVDDALRHYRRALESPPDYVDALNGLGCLLISRDRPAEAVAWLRRAVARAPDRPVLRTNLATALLRSNAGEQAVEQFQEALRLDPGSHDAHAGLGLVRLEQGDLDAAISHLEQAVGPSAPPAPQLHYELGEAYRRRSRLHEAAEQYALALRLQPDHRDALAKLALCRRLAAQEGPAAGRPGGR